jgi:hypothetical protein
MTSFIFVLYISLLVPIIICSKNFEKSIKQQGNDYVTVFTEIGLAQAALEPYPKPTHFPSSTPSSNPITSMPSISHSPTYHRTPSPSSHPSIYIKTDFPTNSPSTPTSVPSVKRMVFPSSLPSLTPSVLLSFSFPSSVPSSYPSQFSAPSSLPSSIPSFKPYPGSLKPSLLPSFQPSQLPTPSGLLGKDWWYLFTTEVTVFATNKDVFSSYDIQEVIDSLQYSFVVEFSDILDLSETEEIMVIVDVKKASSSSRTSSSVVSSQLRSHSLSSISAVQSNENITSSFTVSTWCPSSDIEKKVSEKLFSLHESPEPILL